MPDFDPADADDQGLVAVGGDLTPSTLLRAYRRGVFPWYGEGLPICWWSPDPRAVIPFDGLHISRRLARTIRASKFHITLDQDFVGVLRGCADRPSDGTWLLPEMIEAYSQLHDLGYAHSIEAWLGGELAGGIYGVALGGLFAAESMFHRVTDASKVALAALVQRLRDCGFTLLDVQIINPHTERMGAIEIPRDEYLARLRDAVEMEIHLR
ncbi:MAG: leucyl/phenylalanyl-tRNA--protein transferase [Gemmataceae bacterium]